MYTTQFNLNYTLYDAYFIKHWSKSDWNTRFMNKYISTYFAKDTLGHMKVPPSTRRLFIKTPESFIFSFLLKKFMQQRKPTHIILLCHLIS